LLKLNVSAPPLPPWVWKGVLSISRQSHKAVPSTLRAHMNHEVSRYNHLPGGMGHTLIWYGMVWYGMVWHGMVRYGTVRYGMVW
jgi:hypothetical protein